MSSRYDQEVQDKDQNLQHGEEEGNRAHGPLGIRSDTMVHVCLDRPFLQGGPSQRIMESTEEGASPLRSCTTRQSGAYQLSKSLNYAEASSSWIL